MSSFSNRKKVMIGNRWWLKLLAIQGVFNCMSPTQSLLDACAYHLFLPKSLSALCGTTWCGLTPGPTKKGQLFLSKAVHLLIVSQGEGRCVGSKTDLHSHSVVDVEYDMLARLWRVLPIASVSAETFWRWVKDLGSSHYTQTWLRDLQIKFGSELRS